VHASPGPATRSDGSDYEGLRRAKLAPASPARAWLLPNEAVAPEMMQLLMLEKRSNL
jgi:hypothetical protein